MTEIAVSHKLFSVSTNHDNGWVLVTERATLGGIGDTIPPFLRVLGPCSSRMFGPALPVTFGGDLVAYRYRQLDEQQPSCELMVIND